MSAMIKIIVKKADKTNRLMCSVKRTSDVKSYILSQMALWAF